MFPAGQVFSVEDSRQLDKLIDYLVDQRVRITTQRRFMLDLVVSLNRPFSAMELYQAMEQTFQGLSYGTVYRNLELYKNLRIIETFALDNELRYRLIDHVQPQLHFICMDCKQTIPMSFDPEQMLLPEPQRFQSLNYKIDVFGYCMDCRASSEEGLEQP
ncbi:Fur family transcriptional regulator [Paenibacillus glucanolyticus]|uniref:Fur family transcriptional regulator n=3 Tax=Paenibacillus TaxID=44249 RepID=UPI0009EE5721|nr:Fur family transcriptional regulator [Paenibacillus glucanolyticus]MPY20345.1 transcriptional repressor [Paenibacillus glucanolyticus]